MFLGPIATSVAGSWAQSSSTFLWAGFRRSSGGCSPVQARAWRFLMPDGRGRMWDAFARVAGKKLTNMTLSQNALRPIRFSPRDACLSPLFILQPIHARNAGRKTIRPALLSAGVPDSQGRAVSATQNFLWRDISGDQG